MKIEYGRERIYLIPENDADRAQLERTLPNTSEVLAFYTYDAGESGCEEGLVITHRKYILRAR